MEILITISIDTDERKLYIGQENTSGCEYDIYKNGDIAIAVNEYIRNYCSNILGNDEQNSNTPEDDNIKEVYLVTNSKDYNSKVFKMPENAQKYVYDYLYENSTLEDRTYQKIQKSEYDHQTEYSLYTSEHGDITVTVKKISVN